MTSSPSPNDDTSSVGGKSLDSGVYDTEGNSGVKGHPAGWNDPSQDPNNGEDDKREEEEEEPVEEKESIFAIIIQVSIPFLIAGAGTCGAGIVLDYVEVSTSIFNFVSLL